MLKNTGVGENDKVGKALTNTVNDDQSAGARKRSKRGGSVSDIDVDRMARGKMRVDVQGWGSAGGYEAAMGVGGGVAVACSR